MTKQHDIGLRPRLAPVPSPADAQEYVAFHPRCSRSDVYGALSPAGTILPGALALDRAVALGLVREITEKKGEPPKLVAVL